MVANTKQYAIWKQYPEYPFIEANQFGEIRATDRVVTKKNGKKYHVKGHILKQYNNGRGYMQVSFYVNGKKITRKVHRIVASAFIPNPDNLPEVNHIDCNRANNVVSNLEWCTHEYNTAYREKYGTALNCPIFAVNLKTSKVLHFESQHEAAYQLGIPVQNINHVIKGRLNQAGGYWFTEDKSEITKERIQEIRNNTNFWGGVIAVNLETFKVLRFESQSEAGRQLDVDYRHINDVVKGRRKQTGGYWFCYIDENAVKRAMIEFGGKIAHEIEKMMKSNGDLV